MAARNQEKRAEWAKLITDGLKAAAQGGQPDESTWALLEKALTNLPSDALQRTCHVLFKWGAQEVAAQMAEERPNQEPPPCPITCLKKLLRLLLAGKGDSDKARALLSTIRCLGITLPGDPMPSYSAVQDALWALL